MIFLLSAAGRVQARQPGCEFEPVVECRQPSTAALPAKHPDRVFRGSEVDECMQAVAWSLEGAPVSSKTMAAARLDSWAL